QLGLIRNKRDFFFDRAMFTIHNLQGKPIAFAGRILKKDVKAPKYVNSPESEVYHKSDVLYGLHQARTQVRKLDNVYMVEGYTDVISLHQNGVQNVVATSGTSLTPGQARLVKRQTQNVTLLYDGDKAGIKAALRGVDVLLIEGLNVRVVILPDGEDPDSYMQKVGTTAFEEYLTSKRRDFLFFKADLLLEEAGDDVAARSEAIRSSIATLALVEDPLKRAGYLQQFTSRLGLEESLLVNLVNQAVADRRTKAKKEQEREQRRRERTARLGNKKLPPVRPQQKRDNPPPPTEEDSWAGLVEPGVAPPLSGKAPEPADAPEWGGLTDDGWAGLQEPGFGGDVDFPPVEFGEGPIPELPARDELAEALLYTGHTFQERDLAYLLINHGAKVYDEVTDTSIAAFLTRNIADVLDDFDNALYQKTVKLVMAYLSQHQQGPSPDWYLQHPEPAIQELAISATVKPYSLSPNWKEKYGLRLSQKPPEENHKLAAEILLRIFRMEKIDRKCKENIHRITELDKAGDEKQLILHMKLQIRLDAMRKELAAELGTVVISK
ncbi:MAG: toprim domain-containing protein, partial [Bacteroidota bacterium]